MNFGDRGALQLVALAGAVIAVLGIAAVAGLTIADDSPTGAEVLSDVEDRYESADSVVVDATVTAEYNDTVREFAVHAVATEDGQMRTNVSDGDGYVLVGHTGNTTWLTDSETGATVVLSAGPVAGQPTFGGIGGNALPEAGAATLGGDDESLSAWVYGLDEDAIAEYKDRLNDSERLADVNRSAIAAMMNGSGETLTAHNWSSEGPIAHNWSDHEMARDGKGPNAHNWSQVRENFDRENASVETLFEETNLTAELVETTTLDGQEVHVVAVSHPEREGQLRVWATTDTATVVQYRASTPNGTMTVDVSETRFDVSPADSTFKPPVASQADRTTVDSLADLQASAPGPVAVPGDSWTFRQGSVVASPVDATVAQYEADGSTIAVLQSTSSRLAQFSEDGRTVEVADRTVTVTEITEDRTVAQFAEDGRTVVVTGDLSEADLLEVVGGIEFTTADG